MSSKRCFSIEGNSPYWPKPALLISRSISIPFSLVKAKILSGAFESARSATNTSALTLKFAVSRRANSSRRSFRRAVSTRFVPPDANSSASAPPIPALAPVISAHFPDHFPDTDGFSLCDKLSSKKVVHCRVHGKARAQPVKLWQASKLHGHGHQPN